MPRAKRQTSRRIRKARLAELYNQLQAVMPVLEEIVQPACAQPESNCGEDRPGEIREALQLYTPSPDLEGGTGPRYRFENRGREAWAVLDGRDNDALVIIAKYKKGAAALVERLEDYERRIAGLSHIPPRPAPAGGNPALPSPP